MKITKKNNNDNNLNKKILLKCERASYNKFHPHVVVMTEETIYSDQNCW